MRHILNLAVVKIGALCNRSAISCVLNKVILALIASLPILTGLVRALATPTRFWGTLLGLSIRLAQTHELGGFRALSETADQRQTARIGAITLRKSAASCLMSSSQVTCCINPECRQPSPRPWGDRFCQACGTTLRLGGRYIPLRRLGAGGFSVTYVVLDCHSQTEKVLKVLTDPVPKALALFQQEAQVLASIQHGGIPRVEAGGYFSVSTPSRHLPCLVMEKIDGITLQALLKQQPQGCPPEQIVNWLAQAAEILSVLHNRHIVHRDIKPANLMLRHANSRLVMIDFGGVKQIMRTALSQDSTPERQSSTRLYSPGYSPPEQVSGGVVRPQSDFFALGRTLLHLLTGRFPTELEDPVTGALNWQVHGQFDPALVELLEDMTRDDFRQRPASAADILERLHQFAVPVRNLGEATSRWALPTSSGLKPGASGSQPVLDRVGQGLFAALQASLDTGWSVLLAASGGLAGCALGSLLSYVIPLGPLLVQRLLVLLQQPTATGASPGLEVAPFLLAGLATGIGLTEAGGFGQKQRYFLSALTGLSGYLVGLLGLQSLVALGVSSLALPGFAFSASLLLVLGLGLKRDALLYAGLTALGTAGLCSLLLLLPGLAGPFEPLVSLWPSALLHPDTGRISFREFLSTCSFFATLGLGLGVSLSASHYLLLPLYRRLRALW